MDGCSLQSPTLTSIPTSLSRGGLIERPFGYSQLLKLPTSKKYPHARKLRFIDFKAQPSGTVRVHAEAAGATPAEVELRDDDLVFVAGATGRVGSRTVRELLKLGFRVRAGVRSAQRAENLVQSVKQMKLDPENEGTQPVEKLEIVECDLEKPDEIGAALGNASVVICCIGASEKEVFDITGPYRIDYQATKNLVDAATVAKVDHFIMVSSLGTNKVGFPAAILNLFWGVLIWKRQAEKALIASGLNYTIVRPGGMERPTDAYKETHNITLSQEDTLFGGQVSNLQVAELMACMARNRSLSYCKVVEVIAETTAPLTPMEELLAKIPSQRVEPKKPVTTDGPDPPSSKSIIPEESTAPIPNEPAQTKAKVLQPLSPYSAYEDLKPPSSPSPTPSTTPSAPKASVSDATPVTSVSSLSLDSGATLDKEATQGDVKKMSPLSPYIVYDDLKPPTSPTPTPSGQKNLTIVDGLSPSGTSDTPTSASGLTINITETATQEVPSERPPYVTYDDLKPPTSPTPIPPGQTNLTIVDGLSTSGTSDAQTSAAGVTINITETATEEKPSKRPLSPYVVYEDLKPPTSPSPTPSGPNATPSSNSVLVESVSPLSGGNDVANTSITSVTKNTSHNSTYHLSPYHMYEDLKPPTSPIPSPRKS